MIGIIFYLSVFIFSTIIAYFVPLNLDVLYVLILFFLILHSCIVVSFFRIFNKVSKKDIKMLTLYMASILIYGCISLHLLYLSIFKGFDDKIPKFISVSFILISIYIVIRYIKFRKGKNIKRHYLKIKHKG
ncbi:hypothetical protein Metig_0335 [Methanotorris igneus Kol 5]|uniref:Uncharacterized protein n=1 Tax=Methanotorris igneus (strain DSM 5666 / JCM 11834 / Kol 5) TaxID=880724 RepID=F6BAS7_METIK|nr:hypothetical protein Metig_0335 [Methanotorris igneus Kol 5]